MRKTLIIFALCVCAAAQTGKFPTLATDQDLVVAKTNASSTLMTTVNASTLTWVVADGSKFSAYEIIRSGDEYTQICSISTNTLTLCAGTRGLVGSAATHLAGATVQDVISEYHHNALRAEIKAIEANVIASYDVTSLPGTCTPKAHYTLNTDSTLHRCNDTGDGYDTISGGGGAGDAATTPSVSFSATPTFTCNANTSTTFRITLTGNVTSSTLASCATGQLVTFRICQDGSGAHTFVFPTSVLNAGTIDATASACSVQTFVWDGTFAQALGTMLVTGPAGGVLTLHNSSDSNVTSVAAPATGANALTLPSNNGVILSTLSLPGTSLAGPVKAKVCSDVGADYVVQDINTDASVDCVQVTGGSGSSTAQDTAANIPGTCTTGNLFFPTNSLYTLLRCSSTNTWTYFFDGKAVSPPTGSWSWDRATGSGGGTATADLTNGYLKLKFPSGMNQGNDLSAYYTAFSAPSTKTIVFRSNIAPWMTSYQRWFVGFGDGSGKMYVVFADNNAAGGDSYRPKYGVAKYASTADLAASGGGYVFDRQVSGNMLAGLNVWVQLVDDNTNLIFKLSFDGVTYTTLYTVGRATWFASGPTRILVGAQNAESGGAIGDMSIDVIGVQ